MKRSWDRERNTRGTKGTQEAQEISVARSILVLLVPLVFLSLLLGKTLLAQSRFRVEQNETIRKTLEFAPNSTKKTLDIDNVDGAIRVTGYNGANVEVIANQTIRASSQERLEAAKREVTLDMTAQGDRVRIFVDHPGRCHRSNNSDGCFQSRWEPYRVRFDFEIRVPRDASILIRDINDGDIRVENIAGDFDVNHINGGIQLSEMSGSGHAYTLNGQLGVKFTTNPRDDSYFGSLNGNIDVTFQPNLSADLRFKTFNGGVYTDFPTTRLPAPAPTAENRNGKLVYKSSRYSTVRVGNGGPEIELDGFNGNIKILQAK